MYSNTSSVFAVIITLTHEAIMPFCLLRQLGQRLLEVVFLAEDTTVCSNG